MKRRVYINKSSNHGREFIVLVFIIALIGVACGILWWALSDSNKTEPESVSESANSLSMGTPHVGGLVQANMNGTYFSPSEGEMRHLWEIIRTSPHIAGNKLYSAVIANVEFRYLSDDDDVNAFAAMHKQGGLGVGRKPILCLLGGYVRISRVLALAYAANQSGVTDAMPRLVGIWNKLHNGFSESKMEAFVKDTGLAEVVKNPEILVKAKAISSGMILATLAHEAGHHALGHLHGRVDTDTHEISRNQEREADSFEASIMSISPFGEFMLMGDLLFYAVDAKVGGGGGTHPYSTHPYSDERYNNLVKANPVLAKAIGLSE